MFSNIIMYTYAINDLSANIHDHLYKETKDIPLLDSHVIVHLQVSILLYHSHQLPGLSNIYNSSNTIDTMLWV